MNCWYTNKNRLRLSVLELYDKQKKAYTILRDKILSNEFKAGAFLVERNLCNMLGLSRTPIREALQRLCYEGLITIVPGKASYVNDLTTQDIIEVFELRSNLEVLAIENCIQYGEKDYLVRMKEYIDIQIKCIEKKEHYEEDYRMFIDNDIPMHYEYIYACKNKRLINALTACIAPLHRISMLVKNDFETAKESCENHVLLYEALCADDAQAAISIMKRHNQKIEQYYLSKLMCEKR